MEFREIELIYGSCGHAEPIRIPGSKVFWGLFPRQGILAPGRNPNVLVWTPCDSCGPEGSYPHWKKSKNKANKTTGSSLNSHEQYLHHVDLVEWTRSSLLKNKSSPLSPILIPHEALIGWSNFVVDHFPPSEILRFIEDFTLPGNPASSSPLPSSSSGHTRKSSVTRKSSILTRINPPLRSSPSRSPSVSLRISSHPSSNRNGQNKSPNSPRNNNSTSQTPLIQTLKFALLSTKLNRYSPLRPRCKSSPPPLPLPPFFPSPPFPENPSVALATDHDSTHALTPQPIPATYKTLFRDIKDAYFSEPPPENSDSSPPQSPSSYQPFELGTAPNSYRGQETGYQLARGLISRIISETSFFEDAADIFLSLHNANSPSLVFSSSSPSFSSSFSVSPPTPAPAASPRRRSSINAKMAALRKSKERLLDDGIEKLLRNVIFRAAAITTTTTTTTSTTKDSPFKEDAKKAVGEDHDDDDETGIEGLGKKRLLELARFLTLTLWEGHREMRAQLCGLVGEMVGREVGVWHHEIG